jgi:hypothetical protein
MLKNHPRVVFNTGDLVDALTPGVWDQFREITRELRSQAVYLPAVGNHDVDLAKEFPLERTYYDYRMEDMQFFVLDLGAWNTEQSQWFEKSASQSTARHKIAVFHYPPFSIDPDHYAEAEGVRTMIHGSLVKLKFCAAFCGHNHLFYTTVRDGVRYVVTGGGGAPLWDVDASRAQKGDLFRKFHHYVGCVVTPRGISAKVLNEYGKEDVSLAFPVCEHSGP